MIRSVRAAAVLAALAFAAAGVAVAPAHAQVKGSPSIASYFSKGMCLDTRASDRQVLIWSCHGGWNQAFRFVKGDYGQITLGNGDCLQGGAQKGAGVTAQPCANTPHQKWGFQSDGSLRNEAGWCADIEGAKRDAGTRVISWDCNGGAGNQKWYPAVTAKSAYLGLADLAALSKRTRGTTSILSSPSFSTSNMVAAGGGNLVAAGGGNMVAAGGGNLVGNDGASIVFGGAGSLIGNDGSTLVAAGAGNMVAAGGGNLVPSNWQFFSGTTAGLISR
jgi:hypothetical protein